jgi:HK97 gp10 family phage protein
MQASIKFSGGPQLETALKELGGEIAGRLGSNSVRAGARVIAAEARRKAPVGATGNLKRSITTVEDRDARLARGKQRIAYAGSKLFYARFVEFGTVHAAAKPFLRPALDESAQAAVDKLTDNLGKGIERETVKYRGRGK